MHQRTTIRDYIVALLSANISAGTSVLGKLVDGLADDQIPAVVVKARKDTVKQLLGEEPIEYQRRLLVSIEVFTSGDEDTLNALCDEVELILLKDFRLSGLATGLTLVDTLLEADTGGEQVFWDGMILIHVDYVSTFG